MEVPYYLKESLPDPAMQNEHVDKNVKTESIENFQKFIYDLFDKNGILNDLRAYLRGHIVDVLKSAQTGDPPLCQKHFTQRLDSTYQALNMLVAEYLLCLEFNYTLSVFVSEIPLANMVFDLAKSLMGLGADGKTTGLRFRENDVWSILNYLGMKCDSEHANAITNMYSTQEKSPLLLCILQCAQLCEMKQTDNVSHDGSMSTSSKGSIDKRSVGSQCKHAEFCKACRSRYSRLKDKYRRKKTRYIQKTQATAKALTVDSLMKNVVELERSLIDEMFEQLKTVYETEIDMFKAHHEGTIKNSLASHAQHFQQMQNELEESYKAREEVLQANIVHKKRFLWGLAQSLRAQHSQMARAMQAVKRQTAEISEQEQNLKLQRTQAEESLQKRAEEMRQQIADEMTILEQHLLNMKAEREIIDREKACETKINTDVKEYLQNHYQLLKKELNVLKMYVENAVQPKCLIERSVVTDDVFKGMNNEVERDRGIREARPNQVVNDLKKQKNVNFSQGKSEGESRGSRSASSSEDQRVQQYERQPIQVSAEPPQRPPVPLIINSIVDNECGWRKGAGEERSLLPSARILVPGDSLPFVGVVGRRGDSRRHLLNRWRMLRRRVTPLQVAQVPPEAYVPTENVGIRVHSPPSKQNNADVQQNTSTPTREIRSQVVTETDSSMTRKKSPKSVLKEAKEKLKTVPPVLPSREESPSAVLREAKRRLRKLEIEAEAVERSYMDFRRRRERGPACDDHTFIVPSCIPNTASKLSTHHKDTPGNSKSQLHTTESVHLDLEKYLKKYQIDDDSTENHFNKNTKAAVQNSVPEIYSEIRRKFEPIPKQDYLEKPILEFRKLYYTNQERAHGSQIYLDNNECKSKEKIPDTSTEKDNTQKQFETFNQITKKYISHEKPAEVEMPKDENFTSNLLLVEIENVSQVKDLNIENGSDVVVVVESSVDSKEAAVSEQNDRTEQISTKMTIVVSPQQIISDDVTIERIGAPIELVEAITAPDNYISTNEIFAVSSEKNSSDYDSRIKPTEPESEIKITEVNAVFETVEISDEYPDDFSNDVDNYKSDNSPISLPKSSEDENFWD